MKKSEFNLTQKWDVIIIGSGMGGATAGYVLAQKGLSVLFLEKGGDISANDLIGKPATDETRMERGWWPHPLSQLNDNGSYDRVHAPIGCAMGGSSIHYGAALERMEPSDFEALQTPSQLVSAWPISFEELLPYYQAAETLYGIAGNHDKAWDARLSEWDRAFIKNLQRTGLKPEKLRVAIKYDQDCTECIGVICHRSCKADARVTCLNNALQHENCHILNQCSVESLEANENNIELVHIVYKGQKLALKAHITILSAGAMHSPQILLKSANAKWPNGLANGSDQVGRNLMFHGADIYAIWAPRRLNRQGGQKKSVAVRDFYLYSGRRLGFIQSMGMSANRGYVAGYIKDLLRKHGIYNRRILSLLAKIPSHVVSWLLGDASIFAAQIEDDPDKSNRIVLNPAEANGAHFTYTISADLRERADTLRKAFATHLKPWRLMRLTPTVEINTGHSCGTCRFGDDPATSVLDRNCRSHEVENLYVIDASFMPRSGATNPSLTIAANALRVADKIAERFSNEASLSSH